MPTNLEIVQLVGDDKMVELKDAVASALSNKINALVNTRKEQMSTEMLAKENYDQPNGYEGNTPDEKSLLAKLLKNISKHDYPVKNKDDLPFKALNTHPTGPGGDHAPADPIKVP